MAEKSISLPRDLEAFVEAKLSSGEYANHSEVVCESIRLMMHVEAENLDRLRAAAAEGEWSLENEPIIELTHGVMRGIAARGRARLAELRRAR